ncbi:MAG: hypothetical protein ACLFN2_05670 [Bacteroidales bacterium]
MKQRIVQLSGILLIMWGLFAACSDEEISSQQPKEECPEELAELITGDVERFHRLGLEQIVEETELHPGSGLFNMRFEQIMDLMGENVNDFADQFGWNFEPDHEELKITEEEINTFTALLGKDTSDWFGIFAKQLKSNDEYENDMVDFDKIGIFSEQIGQIISTDSRKECPDEHLEYIQEKLNEVMMKATEQLNEYEIFIVNNMASVGLSSLGSWAEIASEWVDHKSRSGGGGAGGDDEEISIDWELIAEYAKADFVGGLLGCLSKQKAIIAASVAGGPKGFAVSTGGIFAFYSLMGSASFAVWEILEEEDKQAIH